MVCFVLFCSLQKVTFKISWTLVLVIGPLFFGVEKGGFVGETGPFGYLELGLGRQAEGLSAQYTDSPFLLL